MTVQVHGAESKWDEELLNIKFRDVSINAFGMPEAWREITTKYLLRANIYMDLQVGPNLQAINFKKKDATGKEILEALLTAFPAYTYTQDSETGVIWIHPKRIKYKDILYQKISIICPAHQIPMFTKVYEPLCSLLSTNVIAASLPKSGPPYSSYGYFVDLPSGVFSAREILNFCCAANITKAFAIGPETVESSNKSLLAVYDLHYLNPMALPRVASLKFWKIEIGTPSNEIPSVNEVNAALSSTNFAKRWAAVTYLEAAQANYSPVEIIENDRNPEKAVWAALGIENMLYNGIGDDNFFFNLESHFSAIQQDLALIKDPGLALIASLELARVKRDFLNLDEIVKKHKFTDEEIACIRPNIYRLVNESPLVADKLVAMKPDSSGFPVLSELERTNFFKLAPPEN